MTLKKKKNLKKPQTKWKGEMDQVKVEVNELDGKEVKQILKTKNWFFEKMNRINFWQKKPNYKKRIKKTLEMEISRPPIWRQCLKL